MLSKEEKKKLNKKIFNEKKQIIKTSFLGEVIDFFKDLAIIIIVVVVIRTFFVIPFQINGSSMNDSYYDKEFIIVDRFSYLNIPFVGILEKPKRGDVIVFRPNVSKDKEFFIKRIIGLPGEILKIEEGKVYLKNIDGNFEEILEPYLSDTNKDLTTIHGDISIHTYKIPKDSYFVLGDNRIGSTDSRYCFSGCGGDRGNYIVKKDIVGKLLLDLGYYDWIKSWMPFSFGTFSFIQPELGIDSTPKFLKSPRNHKYKFIKE